MEYTITKPYDPEYVKKNYRHRDARGLYNADNLTGPGPSAGESGQPWRGVNPMDAGRCWSAPRTGAYAGYIEKRFIPNYRQIRGVHARLDALDAAGLIHWPKKTGIVPNLKRYLAGSPGRPLQDLILDIKQLGPKSKERTGYPTQKPPSPS